jgi:hypothetical protein
MLLKAVCSTSKGTKTVSIVGSRDLLRAHKPPPTPGRRQLPSKMRKRTTKAWGIANVEGAKDDKPLLVTIGLHECHHTFVPVMAEACLPLERIGDAVSHRSAISSTATGTSSKDTRPRLVGYSTTVSPGRTPGGARSSWRRPDQVENRSHRWRDPRRVPSQFVRPSGSPKAELVSRACLEGDKFTAGGSWQELRELLSFIVWERVQSLSG